MNVTRVLPLLLVAALTLPLRPVSAQTRYSFTRIADDTGDIRAIGIAPVSLNDAGQVAFIANGKTGLRGVFTGSGGPLTTVADASGKFQAIGFNDQNGLRGGFSSINGQGQVAFGGFAPGLGSGYFAGSGGSTTIATNILPILGFSGEIFSSGSGTVSTFEADMLIQGRRRQAIIVGNGGPLTTIVDTTSTFADLDLDPRVNASGQVAFRAVRRDGSQGIFVGNGSPLTTIADSSGPFAAFSDAPAINDAGQVLFQATLKAAGECPEINGLFFSSGGKITPVAVDTGAFCSFGYGPALNAQGQIAFQGTAQDGLVGIFTGGDPVKERVIAVGDALDGSKVADLSALSFRTALNNNGQIAFIAKLKDGRTGVYRADPERHGHGGHDHDQR